MNKKNVVISFALAAVMLVGCSAQVGDAGPVDAVSAPPPLAGKVEGEAGERDGDMDDAGVWKKVEDAYIFTFPLVIMDAMATQMTNTVEATDKNAPVNQLIHSRRLANADSKSVVTPNVDTVYTQSHMDLGDTALVFHKPRTERYCSIELLDAYTNCTAVMGTGGDTQDERTYLIAGPDFAGETPDGMVRVDMPTQNAWMLVRTMVEDGDDLENVYAIQEQMTLTPLDAWLAGGEYEPPRGEYDEENDYVPVEKVFSLPPDEYFSRANELMEKNTPFEEDKEALEEFAEIGVGPGLEFDPAVLGNGAEDKWRDMLSGMSARLQSESEGFMLELGQWECYGYPIAEFGTEYAYRALVALGGLGANPVSVAVYPKIEDIDGAKLDGKNNYVIRFEKDALPPVEENGFWSITAYGDDNFLIDNELNRYIINDRSSLKYNEDGSLDIYVQAGPPEDKDLMGNWLPVKEEGFHLYLRIYLPDGEVVSGGWEAPLVSVAG